jgi:hypothetical protein
VVLVEKLQQGDVRTFSFSVTNSPMLLLGSPSEIQEFSQS